MEARIRKMKQFISDLFIGDIFSFTLSKNYLYLLDFRKLPIILSLDFLEFFCPAIEQVYLNAKIYPLGKADTKKLIRAMTPLLTVNRRLIKALEVETFCIFLTSLIRQHQEIRLYITEIIEQWKYPR